MYRRKCENGADFFERPGVPRGQVAEWMALRISGVPGSASELRPKMRRAWSREEYSRFVLLRLMARAGEPIADAFADLTFEHRHSDAKGATL